MDAFKVVMDAISKSERERQITALEAAVSVLEDLNDIPEIREEMHYAGVRISRTALYLLGTIKHLQTKG